MSEVYNSGGMFPGSDTVITQEAFDWLLQKGHLYNYNYARVAKRRYWHHTVWNNNVTNIIAFNANKAPGITNLPTAGFVEQDTVFMAKGLVIRPTDISNAGAIVDMSIDDAITGPTVMKTLAQAMQGGEVIFKVGQNEVFRVNGVDNFLPSNGFNVSGPGTPAANALLLFMRGGDGTDTEGYKFDYEYPISNNDRIEVKIEWPAAIAHGVAGGIPLRFELVGNSVFKAA